MSEPMADSPHVKPSGAVGLARSSSPAGLGASAGFLLPNLLLGIFWFTALVTLILISGFLAIGWIVVMGVTLGVLSLIRKPKWHMLIGGLTLMIAPVMWLCVSGAQIERRRVAKFLGYRVPSPYQQLAQRTVLASAHTRAGDPAVWRDLAYLLLLLPVGAAEFAFVIGAFALPLVTVVLPMWLFVAFPEGIPLGQGVQIDTLLEALLIAIIALPVLALVGYLLVIGMSKAHVTLDQALLWPSKRTRLAQRVEELTESRSRAVEATIAERRRIERDLHDGAQQRLISLAMGLGMAKEKMVTDPETAQELVEEAHGEVKRTLAEIRNLVRGIHPAVLSDRGLDAAIPALAVRCPVPVEVGVELDERLPEAAETTSYFMVAEALTNIAKHSGASEAQVFVRREHKPQNRLVIEVVDNGKGGAEPEGGTGLAGLADRLAALDGRLFIESPPGGPTRVQAELPLGTLKTTTRGTL